MEKWDYLRLDGVRIVSTVPIDLGWLEKRFPDLSVSGETYWDNGTMVRRSHGKKGYEWSKTVLLDRNSLRGGMQKLQGEAEIPVDQPIGFEWYPSLVGGRLLETEEHFFLHLLLLRYLLANGFELFGFNGGLHFRRHAVGPES